MIVFPYPPPLPGHLVFVSVGKEQLKAYSFFKLAKPSSSLASEIAQARQKIQNFLKSGDYESDLVNRVHSLELEKDEMKQRLIEMSKKMEEISKKLDELTLNSGSKIKIDKHQSELPVQNKLNVNGPAEDDDIDLFGSDEETDEDKRIKEERLKAYENKKAKKPVLVAKSSVVLDVKPWSDETDMKELEIAVRKIAMDGLTWGASKLVPLAYGIRKLQIIAIVEDDKVSVDGLQESIEEIEDLVQSVDIAAFNKL
ncbi:elongation factor 1-beta [Trichonephila inaurata madagascariensis]|uniref:Elongation factor 1-beta n=1 Tax=Trichonephila inaurata madagascariensis TaxID=2747483 RepID=A0A8X6X0T0_9ARAC|nr:elongation factor 1-beta [Trichonephila inaurata madagascariensis]